MRTGLGLEPVISSGSDLVLAAGAGGYAVLLYQAVL